MNGQPRLLLIEDAIEIQQMYNFGLTKAGFKVDAVGNAGEALALVQNNNVYNVILLDLMLGGMSGLDFLKESQIKIQHPETKVVVFTNIDNPEVMTRVNAEGVDGYLLKSETDPKALNEYLYKILKMEPPAAAATPTPPAA